MNKFYKRNMKRINIILLCTLIILALSLIIVLYSAHAATRDLSELKELENQRKQYEIQELDYRAQAKEKLELAKQYETKKLELEPKIRAQRAKILGK